MQLPKTDVADKILAETKAIIIRSATSQIVGYNNILTALKALYAEGIPVVVLKGTYLKSLYPEPEFRIMGDSDILISDEADLKKAFEIMKQLGYSKCQIAWDEVEFSREGTVKFEVHKQLDLARNRNLKTEVCFTDYSKCLYEEIDNVNLLILPHTDNLVYLFTHMVSHFVGGGFGFRQVFDIALFVGKRGEFVEWKRFWENSKVLQLDKFACNIFMILKKYFGVDISSIQLPEDFNDYSEELLERIYKNGVFGRGSKDSLYSNLMASGYVKGNIKSKNAFVNIINTLFPAKLFEEKYQYTQKHRFLLPIAWTGRIFTFMRNRFKFSDMKYYFTNANAARAKIDLIDKLGLKGF